MGLFRVFHDIANGRTLNCAGRNAIFHKMIFLTDDSRERILMENLLLRKGLDWNEIQRKRIFLDQHRVSHKTD